jgi:transcriptional regulator of acetoin/glycerol metabolism
VTPPARLVRLHRHNVTNVLVMGGSAEQRLQIAYAFHRESLVRRGPFVCVDGERDELRLRMSIQSRVSSMCPDVPADPLRAAEHGTFFLDSVGSMSKDTQRMLLAFLLRCVNVSPADDEGAWVGRLVAGSTEHLSIAVGNGCFSAALYDFLDKVRVELPVAFREHAA